MKIEQCCNIAKLLCSNRSAVCSDDKSQYVTMQNTKSEFPNAWSQVSVTLLVLLLIMSLTSSSRCLQFPCRQKSRLDSTACTIVWKTGTYGSLQTVWFEWPEFFVSFCSNRSITWQITLQVLGIRASVSLCFDKRTCPRNTTLCYSLHAASDSSDPSGHSSSPSHFHLAGMQCPLSQVKSDSAQVFLAARKEESTWHEYKQCRRSPLQPTPPRTIQIALY